MLEALIGTGGVSLRSASAQTPAARDPRLSHALELMRHGQDDAAAQELQTLAEDGSLGPADVAESLEALLCLTAPLLEPNEARGRWAMVAKSWRDAGRADRELDALSAQALIDLSIDPSRASSGLLEIEIRGRSHSDNPRELARSLMVLGIALGYANHESPAGHILAAAAAQLRKEAPNSLERAVAEVNLGLFATDMFDASHSALRSAATILEKEAPDSPGASIALGLVMNATELEPGAGSASADAQRLERWVGQRHGSVEELRQALDQKEVPGFMLTASTPPAVALVERTTQPSADLGDGSSAPFSALIDWVLAHRAARGWVPREGTGQRAPSQTVDPGTGANQEMETAIQQQSLLTEWSMAAITGVYSGRSDAQIKATMDSLYRRLSPEWQKAADEAVRSADFQSNLAELRRMHKQTQQQADSVTAALSAAYGGWIPQTSIWYGEGFRAAQLGLLPPDLLRASGMSATDPLDLRSTARIEATLEAMGQMFEVKVELDRATGGPRAEVEPLVRRLARIEPLTEFATTFQPDSSAIASLQGLRDASPETIARLGKAQEQAIDFVLRQLPFDATVWMLMDAVATCSSHILPPRPSPLPADLAAWASQNTVSVDLPLTPDAQRAMIDSLRRAVTDAATDIERIRVLGQSAFQRLLPAGRARDLIATARHLVILPGLTVRASDLPYSALVLDPPHGGDFLGRTIPFQVSESVAMIAYARNRPGRVPQKARALVVGCVFRSIVNTWIGPS